jgi:hypothetical protein
MMRVVAISLIVALAGCSQKAENETVVAADTTPPPIAAAAPATQDEGGTPFDVPSDSRAKYYLLNVAPGESGNIVATTRREGPSGTTYSRREINCDAQTFRYIGEGDTLEQAKQPAPNPGEMSPLVDGSISDVAVKFSCSQ